MAYREPGVYLELVNTTPMVGNTPVMYPCIVGEGPKFVDFTKIAMSRPKNAIVNPAGASSVHVTAASDDTVGTLVDETTYYYAITYANSVGETIGATEATVVTGVDKTSLRFTLADAVKTAGFPTGATRLKVYVGESTGNTYYAGAITALDGVLIVSDVPLAAVEPPVANSTVWSDELPATKVTVVNRIYTITNGLATDIVSTGNWALSGDNIIEWVNGGPNVPSNSSVYYVDFEARPEPAQYGIQFVTNFSQLDSIYDGMFMKLSSGGVKTTINPVYLGAYLALEAGASGVKVVQVEPANKSTYGIVEATDFQNTLDNHVRYDASIYRVVPITRNSSVINAFISHCNIYSAEEERKERITFVGKQFSAVAKSELITELKGYTESIANKRVVVPFPDQGTKVLSDGRLHTLGHEYICAAAAGLASVVAVSKSLTRQRLYNFVELKCSVGTGTKFTRSEMNDIAAAGVMLLEQSAGSGTPIIIRHQLTTNMSRVSDRELSIITTADYVAKFLRSSLEGYIGVYNINSDTIARITQTAQLILSVLIRDKVINEGKVTSLAQDEANPDTVLMSVKIKPEYPCNYIDITMLLE